MRAASLLVVCLVPLVAVTACPADRPGGDGEGEGEGEEGEGEAGEGEGEGVVEGPALSEVSCQGGDWVEVKNLDATPLDLAGWSVTDDVARADRREALFGTLEPGARAAFDVVAFGISCTDRISLLDGDRVHEATTLSVATSGASWARLPEPIDGASSFAEAFPTRGQPNQGLAVSSMRINEVDCRGFERVEIINAGDVDVDITGYVLAIDPASAAGRFTLPSVTVPAGTRFVVAEADGVNAGFDFAIDCNNGALLLLDDGGVILDSVVTGETAEDFTWSRLPDGNGEFAAGEETLGAANTDPVVRGTAVFDPGRLATVTLDLTGALSSTPLPCTFTWDDDASVACTAASVDAGVIQLAFPDPAARFQQLTGLVLDISGRDPSLARAVVASAVYRDNDVVAPRVGLGAIAIDGAAAVNGLVIEDLNSDALERIFSSTEHLYEASATPLDLVAGDVGSFVVVDGDAVDRADLQRVVDTIAALAPAAFFAGADDVIHLTDSLRAIAVDAWLANAAGYAPTQTRYRIHLDGDGQALLLPGDLGAVLGPDGPLAPAGSVFVDACRADPDCLLELDAQLAEANRAIEDDIGIDALTGLVDDVQAALGAGPSGEGADVAALDALRARLIARPAEVALRL